MAVNPRSLETPERELALETREEGRRTSPASTLRNLRAQIEALRGQKAPAPPWTNLGAYSREWWQRGWEAGWQAALDALPTD